MAPNVGHDRAVLHWAIRTLRSTMDMRPQALAQEVVAMRALVVYESMYGNTKEIATAVADGVSRRMPVQLVEVGAAPTAIADDIALLVVGAPTHGHGMSKDASRKSAAERTSIDEPPVISRNVGLREWLEGLESEAAPGNPPAARLRR